VALVMALTEEQYELTVKVSRTSYDGLEEKVIAMLA
jgi:hypothetical protein